MADGLQKGDVIGKGGCLVCGFTVRVKVDSKGRPTYNCSECDVQVFIRSRDGAEKMVEKMGIKQGGKPDGAVQQGGKPDREPERKPERKPESAVATKRGFFDDF